MTGPRLVLVLAALSLVTGLIFAQLNYAPVPLKKAPLARADVMAQTFKRTPLAAERQCTGRAMRVQGLVSAVERFSGSADGSREAGARIVLEDFVGCPVTVPPLPPVGAEVILGGVCGLAAKDAAGPRVILEECRLLDLTAEPIERSRPTPKPGLYNRAKDPE